MKTIVFALGIGFVLDALFGDPHWLPHPVVLIGKWISFLEKQLRRLFPKTPGGERAGGTVLALLVLLASAAVPWGILWLAGLVHPYLRFAVECFMCYQILAARSLKTESMRVYRKLQEGNLEESRKAVSWIVGRDTENLTMEGVSRAAVETVAENTSDGVIAPMLYLALGGPVLGFFYKAVNTMDSMIAYKNDRYLYFGRTAAHLDDVFNYIPARLSGLFMILASAILGFDGKNAWRIFKRDRYNHASPNSAQTEAVCAGALDVQLAGDAWYFGVLHKKKTIGDPIRQVEPEDIRRANRLMYGTAVIGLILFSGLSFLLYWVIL